MLLITVHVALTVMCRIRFIPRLAEQIEEITCRLFRVVLKLFGKLSIARQQPYDAEIRICLGMVIRSRSKLAQSCLLDGKEPV